MIKFPSIDSVRHVATHVRREADFHGTPLPKIEYEGRVKLHGTNAGIHVNMHEGADRRLIPQGRNNILGVGEADNAGFAQWVATNYETISDQLSLLFDGQEITVYGEWCGGNIQKNVGLNQLPKMFVVFGYVNHAENWVDADGSERGVLRPFPFFTMRQVPSKMGIDGVVDVFEKEANDKLPHFYHIDQVPPVKIEIDFADPNAAVQTMEALTADYEAECPWAKLFGVENSVGEGLVWTPSSVYEPNKNSGRMVFKTKGEKHGNPATKNKVKVAVETEKLSDFNALIAAILPDWRLEQAKNEVQRSKGKASKLYTGDFLKWTAQDILKEESDVIVASEFPLPVVMAEVSKAARRWYFQNTEE